MQTRKVIALLVTAIFLTSLLSFYAFSPDLSYTTTIDEGSMNIDSAFLVFRDGTTYASRNGETGAISYTGTNASEVIHESIDDLTPNRAWKEQIMFKGNLTLTTSIILPSYTTIKINGRLTLAPDTDTSLFLNSNPSGGDTDIEIDGGFWDGTKANQTGGHGVEWYNVTRCIVQNANISDFNGYGVFVNGTDTAKRGGVRVSNNVVENCGSDGIFVYRAEYSLVVIENNFVYDNAERGIQVSTSYRYIIQSNTVGLQNHQNTLDGISINGAGAGPECIIADNTANFNGRHGIYAIHTLGLTISGNAIMGNDYHGIFIEGIYSRLCVITGNYIADNSLETANTYDGIHIDTDNNTITGNALRNIGPVYQSRSGIYITGDNNAVVGNTITGHYTDGISIINANATVVVGNRCLGNAGYGVNEGGTSDYTLLDGNILTPNTTGNHNVDAANSVVGDNIA